MTNTDEKKQSINKIPDDTIINCAIATILETQGVSRLTGGLSESLSKNIFGIDPSQKGIKLSKNDEGLIFDIYVIVEYQAKIPQLAWDLQGKIKEAIEKLTALKVLEVNIHVQGVDLPGEE